MKRSNDDARPSTSAKFQKVRSETSQIFMDNPLELEESSQIFIENPLELEEASQIFIENPIELDESSQIFMENPLSQSNLVGAGFENSPNDENQIEPERNGGSAFENLEEAILFEEFKRRRIEKYKGEEVIYRIRIDPNRLPLHVQDNPIAAMHESVRYIFNELISRSTESLRSTDLIRICIQATGLDKPISTNLIPCSSISVEQVLSVIMKVLQSKDEIRLDNGFTADVLSIRKDIGGGPNRGILNIEVDRLRKQSVLSIPVDDTGLCCAKAIVFALAHLESDRPAINAMKDRRRPALLKRAKALHEAAGVPLGACTYSEVAIFEDHLDLQIVVISSDNLNKVSYKGRRRQKRINLWLHNGHYDVIKSLKGFYGMNFYCEECEKPYNHLENHMCSHKCPVCLRDVCLPGEPQRCENCDRLCRSLDCFRSHKATPGKLVLDHIRPLLGQLC